VLALYFLRYGGASPTKILLVVDDLDRCKPEHLLSVMESIKLLVEDRQISCRVQVVMLIEEEVLRHAIAEKYRFFAQGVNYGGTKRAYGVDRLISETCEKLFTAHLRLPPLSMTDLRDLIEHLMDVARFLEHPKT
jgi:hypothetical protein